MTDHAQRRLAIIAAFIGLAGLAACSHAPVRTSAETGAGSTRWVATWTASPQPADPAEPLALTNQTIRQVVRISLGGPRVRVRLSNLYGTAPLVVSAARVALHAGDSAIHPASDRALGFGGAPSVTIPPGALVLSDPVALAVPAHGDVAISLYLSGQVASLTEHGVARATGYISAPGDFTAAPVLVDPTTTPSRHFVFGVDVEAAPAAAVIVAFGDSIVDGVGSSRDANRRWPDRLAERLSGAGGAPRAVVNAGIAGNRVIGERVGDSGLSRFDRDVLTQPGVRHVIIAGGIVDVGASLGGPEPLIAGYRQLIARARARGVRVIGTTLLPFEGATINPGFYTPANEAVRQAVNAWIRSTDEYDAVIDFDAVIRDPARPSRMQAAFDAGDHLHPSDAGYQAMADAIDLAIFDDGRGRPRDAGRWVATWAASPQRADPDDEPLVIAGQTLRQVVHASLGGPRVRVRLSNAYGTAPLTVGAAHVALVAPATGAAGAAPRRSASSIDPMSDRALTFGGQPGVVIPRGAFVVSDPVTLTVPAGGDLAISLYLPDTVTAMTVHAAARTTGYVSAAGDFTAAPSLADPATTTAWHFVTGVEVDGPPGAQAIVAFGGSIADGVGSTVDASRRWVDRLAERLAARGTPRGVANAGIAGNRLLSVLIGDSGLARFDRDVLALSGVRYAIVLIGTNDLGVIPGIASHTADEIIAGYRQLIARAHALGVKVVGTTLTPFEGSGRDGKFYSAAGEATRQAVNRWIRTSGAFDGVVDFDSVLRDPERPARLRPEFDAGDHLHPNDAGHRAMADAIDLAMFDGT